MAVTDFANHPAAVQAVGARTDRPRDGASLLRAAQSPHLPAQLEPVTSVPTSRPPRTAQPQARIHPSR
jgi:hypothetical protein